MTVYLHSRFEHVLNRVHRDISFNNIDKVETEVEEIIETFLFIRVLETLEILFQNLTSQ